MTDDSKALKKAMELYMRLARSGDPKRLRESYRGDSTFSQRYLSTARFAIHEVQIDEPVEFGGSGRGPNPAEVMLAALTASVGVTCRAWAAFLEIPCDDITLSVSGELDVRGFMDTDNAIRSGFANINVRLDITGPVSTVQLDELKALISRCCPILDTVRNGSVVDLEVIQKDNHGSS